MTSTNKPAPREFWLCESDLDGAEAVCGEENESHQLHVIEYQAYLDLKEKLEVAIGGLKNIMKHQASLTNMPELSSTYVISKEALKKIGEEIKNDT